MLRKSINQGHSHFVIVFGARMSMSFIITKNNIVSIKWSYSSLQLWWLLSLRWLSCFKHVVHSNLNMCLFCVHFQTHTKPHTTQIHVAKLGMFVFTPWSKTKKNSKNDWFCRSRATCWAQGDCTWVPCPRCEGKGSGTNVASCSCQVSIVYTQ